jgi:hypothetical protein
MNMESLELNYKCIKVGFTKTNIYIIIYNKMCEGDGYEIVEFEDYHPLGHFAGADGYICP